ncbi:hypothetical protein FCULG_00003678 [Fusarium culmorum]|uniref:Uncharacterized protein n=1 Tax=Fusarium culmorum TaxID=5516 RepID=A0A2T4H6X4_FUSCU|nr:hypothetical protein FCULG_00003678 [Fusarium culmorum]
MSLPPSASSPNLVPSAPPPPPPSSHAPAAPPPPPPSAAPPPPRARSSVPPPPPPPGANHATSSLAAQATLRAAGQASPNAAPPPPPASAPSPPPPTTRSRGSSLRHSMLDPSMFTLTANGGKSPSPTHSPSQAPGGGHIEINDPRWQFKDEGLFPKPRDFVGGTRRYRAGRGSSIPLDLSAL